MNTISVAWTDLKTFATDRSVGLQYITANNSYLIYAFDGQFGLSCVIPLDGSDSADQTDFENNYMATANQKIDKKSSSGAQVVDTSVMFGLPDSTSLTLNTHDWGDRTTWYQKSIQVSSETLTDSGDGLTFNSANANWVNLDSLRLMYNYNVVPERDGTFTDRSTRRPLVSVNASQLNDPTTPATPGYTIDYAAGSVTFETSQSGNTVQVTYWHNNGVSRCSEWILNPPSGMAYVINYVELQFSQTMVFESPLHLEFWSGGSLEQYSDFDMTLYAEYGQYKGVYRGAGDLLNFCTNRSSQSIPAFGELTVPVLIFPFDYLIQMNLFSSTEDVMVFSLENDIALSGTEISTATFYMQIVPESSI